MAWLNYGGALIAYSYDLLFAENLSKQDFREPWLKGKDYDTHAASHGLAVSRKGSYSWCFISESSTDGPAKLRWRSVTQVERWRQYLILQQSSAPVGNNIWIIDPINGIAGQIGDLFQAGIALRSPKQGPPIEIRSDTLFTYISDYDEYSKPDTIPLRQFLPEMDSIGGTPWQRP